LQNFQHGGKSGDKILEGWISNKVGLQGMDQMIRPAKLVPDGKVSNKMSWGMSPQQG